MSDLNSPDSNIIPHPFQPTVSIIIPVYNGMRTMRNCLGAITRLDYPADRLEVIVVDNNSKDGTPELVSQYPVQLIYEREIQGPHAATNTGVRVAGGEILAFTDSDCVPEADWLKKLVEPFQDEKVVCTGGRIEAFCPNSRVERFIDQMKPLQNGVQPDPSFPMAFVTANAACRREDFLAVGMFNGNMYTGAEVDLFYRLQIQTGKRAVYVPDALILHMFSSTLRSLKRHSYIYGYGEILLATIYKNMPHYPWTPRAEAGMMARQVGALFTYAASLVFRTLTFPLRKGVDSDYLWWPILWMAAEAANVRGKLEGLWVTRFYRRKFWEEKVRVI